MNISIHVGSKILQVSLPYAGADHVATDAPCPLCAKSPLRVRGHFTRHDRDTYYSDAIALCCKARIGEMRTKVKTVFGIEEDDAVLNGRARVYR